MTLTFTERDGSLDPVVAHAFNDIATHAREAVDLFHHHPETLFSYVTVVHAADHAIKGHTALVNKQLEGIEYLKKAILLTGEFASLLPSAYLRDSLFARKLLDRLDVEGATITPAPLDAAPVLYIVEAKRALEQHPSVASYNAMLAGLRE